MLHDIGSGIGASRTCSRNAGSRDNAAAKAASLPMPIPINASVSLCLHEAGTSPALHNTACSSDDAALSSKKTGTGDAAGSWGKATRGAGAIGTAEVEI